MIDISEDNYTVLKPRYTQDSHRPNNYGYRLIEFCKAQSLFILNGRFGRDEGIGKCTSNGCAVVDYILGTADVFPYIEDFDVEPFDALMSDVHCPIRLILNINDCKSVNMNNFWVNNNVPYDLTVTERVKRFDPNLKDTFIHELTKLNVTDLNLKLTEENASIAEITNDLTSLIFRAAKATFGTTHVRATVHS